MLQWGRCLSAAEISIRIAQEQNAALLQWGRCLSAAEIKGLSEEQVRGFVLQWGRCLSAAEMIDLDGMLEFWVRASMGPLPFSSGNRQKPRYIGRWPSPLQWGRCLSAAEMCHSGKAADVSGRSFNGAAAFQQRKFRIRP